METVNSTLNHGARVIKMHICTNNFMIIEIAQNHEYNLAKLVFTLTQIGFKSFPAAKTQKPTLPLMPQLTYPTRFWH